MKNQMKKFNFPWWIAFLFITPYFVGFSPTDSSFSDISVGLGGGHFVYEDCHGTHEKNFVDIGVSGSYKFDGPFRVGGMFGVADFSEDEKQSLAPILYPDLALDWRGFSIGTTGLRIGNRDELNVQLGWLNSAPAFSGKGFFHTGVEFAPGEPFSKVYVGANALPYYNWGVIVQPEFPLSDNNYLFVTGRYGTYHELDEWGMSVGIRMRK
jgi:hypothetical protein